MKKRTQPAPLVTSDPGFQEVEKLARERIAEMKDQQIPGAPAVSKGITTKLKQKEVELFIAKSSADQQKVALATGRQMGAQERSHRAAEKKRQLTNAIKGLFKMPPPGLDLSNDGITDYLLARSPLYSRKRMKGLVSEIADELRKKLRNE